MMVLVGLTSVEHVMQEVMDSPVWTIFTHFGKEGGLHLPLWNIFGFQVTRFMVLEVIVAALLITIFVPLARWASRSPVPQGPFWNTFESMLTFLRDEVARPCLMPHSDGHGEHYGEHHERPEDQVDKYVPYLWTVFLFVLFCNLLGLIPTFGSPTASLSVTGALALVSFVMMHGAAIAKMGVVRYVKSLWPAMELPTGNGVVLKPVSLAFGFVIKLLIFVIEVLGTVIKSAVLAVRLFANMFAGHMVLGMILFFIILAANLGLALWVGITVASVLGVVALSLLELFVAFLQAYIFTFLTALFMGMALNPQH
jgi:F-type H+-transporting ATPase subunit a